MFGCAANDDSVRSSLMLAWRSSSATLPLRRDGRYASTRPAETSRITPSGRFFLSCVAEDPRSEKVGTRDASPPDNFPLPATRNTLRLRCMPELNRNGMPNMRWMIVCLFLAAQACTTTGTQLRADLALTSVQRPEDVAERWGEYRLEAADTSGYTYEDDLVSLAIVPVRGTFSTVLQNRTEHSIRLLWAEGSYVGPSGLASGIVPGETRWIEMNNAPAAQVIPTNARAAFLVIPRANANTSANEIEGFYGRSATCEDINGSSRIRLILPLEIQGVTNEYTLEFEPDEPAIVDVRTNLMDSTTEELSRVPCV